MFSFFFAPKTHAITKGKVIYMTRNQTFKNEIIDKLTAEKEHCAKRMAQYEERLVKCENNKMSSAEHKAKTAANIRAMMDYTLGRIKKIDDIIAEVESL